MQPNQAAPPRGNITVDSARVSMEEIHALRPFEPPPLPKPFTPALVVAAVLLTLGVAGLALMLWLGGGL